MSNYILKIVDDPAKFAERVPEILGDTSYEQIKHVAADLKDTIKANKDLVALCAPQIGQNLRLFCVRFSDNKIKTFLNPMIVKQEGLHLSREVNASLKDEKGNLQEYIIPRHNDISVAYQQTDGRVEVDQFKGILAEVIQQMVEMLDGILLSDYGLPVLKGFDKATKDEKQQIITMYLDSLRAEHKGLKEEIDSNPELKNINDNIEFMKGVILGDIKPVDKDGNIVEAKKEEKK